MSFVDLATLTMHRRTEMESRIHTFDEKCDRAINDIKKLKMQAHSFVTQLNCEPTELKERFLTYMKKLDEFTYLITDFNLALAQIEDIGISEHTPEQDVIQSLPPTFTFTPNNLMDALSEPAPSTSTACSNFCPPEKPKRVTLTKEDQMLITFSSSSTSSESVPCQATTKSKMSEMVTKEVQCSLVQDMGAVSLESDIKTEQDTEVLEPCNLPQQTILEVGREYFGAITSINGAHFWIIIDDFKEFEDFLDEVTEFYRNNPSRLSVEEAKVVSCCAFYDEDNELYYRALYINESEDVPGYVQLFLVDMGEVRDVPRDSLLPLAPQLCARPPYARYCHLAGIDLVVNNDRELMAKYEIFMNKCYVSRPCSFLVDDNSSESVGMIVKHPNGLDILNNLLVDMHLARPIDKNPHSDKGAASATVLQSTLPSSCKVSETLELDDLDIDGPEYEDPVEAVTGYHNRDEADICKHYKGGPDKTCFKGSRCTKKHIMKHPDGWTLDKVEAMAKCKGVPLAAPGSWLKVMVTHVCHYDRVYVHIVDEDQKDEVPEFGVVLPPSTLDALIRDMNSAAALAMYRPLKLMPAVGEIVAALYPPDNRWYRARVLSVTRYDQSVEVFYIDYGTVMWVKEDQLRALEERHAVLPAQAVRCKLAGVHMSTQDSTLWARAKRALADMAMDRVVPCHVIARDYDEITIELLDNDGYSVAEQLAAQDLIELRDFQVEDDSQITHKVIVP